MERWLAVVGWEGVYEVSDLANIRRIVGGKGTRAGRAMKPTRLAHGYEVVRLRLNGRTEVKTVHSIVAAAFIGPRRRRYEVNHLNGIRHDNRLTNLAYCTPSQNKIHSYAELSRPKNSMSGEENGRAKLSAEQVKEIRRRYSCGGISQQSLANEFGMSQPVISQIIRKTAWSLIS